MGAIPFVHDSPFFELATLLAFAAAVGFIGLLLRQPLIIGFIAVGVLSGPSALGLVRSHESIDLLAELGIAVLLFLVGLKLDLNLIRTLGVVAVATGLGQVAFTSILGFLIGLALGLDAVTSIYVAVALTFSSTIIIVKLLSDKREIDSLHGRIALGFLIVQDLVVVFAMVVLATLGVGADQGATERIILTIAYAAGAVVAVLLFIRFVANPLVRRIARSPELLLTFAIAWAALLGALGERLGFSMELGGLLAGVSLASTPYREAIVSRLAPLRDFLLLFFFIALGSQLDIGRLGDQIAPAIVFSLFVLIGNPLIVMVIMGVMGYRKRTGFLAGLTVAQISEFSLIFTAMGVSLGHLQEETLGLVTVVGMVTIALSVYMITYSHHLYAVLEPAFSLLERAPRNGRTREETPDEHALARRNYDAIVFGLGRYGSIMATRLREAGWKVLGVDFNPEEVRRCRAEGFDALYGDASDHEFIDAMPLEGVRWIIAAFPPHEQPLSHENPRIALLDALRQRGFAGRVAVPAQTPREARTLKEKGAHLILLPFRDAAQRAARRILERPAEPGEEDDEEAAGSSG
jgi:Kef-type K+ transport system membrane component KefB